MSEKTTDERVHDAVEICRLTDEVLQVVAKLGAMPALHCREVSVAITHLETGALWLRRRMATILGKDLVLQLVGPEEPESE